jgi:4-amino-4-deoxy-L-arabinose transferase-like glycosyltransferase
VVKPDTSRRSTRFTLALAAVLACSALAGWLVFVELVGAQREPKWDEVAHAMKGALIAHDLRELDWLGFLLDSYVQIYWPPVHSWLVGGAFLLAGQNLEAARAVSVIAYVLLAPTLFLVAYTIDPRRGILAGIVAAALALASPGVITSAAESMLELPGLLAFGLTILAYCALAANPEARPRTHALLGAGVVLTYLVKSNYAIVLIIGIIFAKLVAADFRPRRLATRENLYAALPLVLFCTVWFAYPPRIVWTWRMLFNTPWGGEAARGLSGLWFYPRAIADLSGSWWMSALLWGGLAGAWRSRHRHGIAFLALLALTMLLIGTFHHTKIDRHILPVFPSLFVLTGFAAGELWGWLRSRENIRAVAVGFLGAIVLVHTATLYRGGWKTWEPREASALLDYLSRLTRANAPVLVIGAHDAGPSPPLIDWHLTSVAGLQPVTAASNVYSFHNLELFAEAIGRAPLPDRLQAAAYRSFDRYYDPALARSLHLTGSFADDQALFETYFRETLERTSPGLVIAVLANPDTTGFEGYLAPGLARAGYREVSARPFPSLGSEVHLYRRP